MHLQMIALFSSKRLIRTFLDFAPMKPVLEANRLKCIFCFDYAVTYGGETMYAIKNDCFRSTIAVLKLLESIKNQREVKSKT